MKDAKITKIEPLFLRYLFPAPIRYVYSGGIVENMDAAYVRVMTEDGDSGLGEITHGQFCYEPIIGLVQHFDRLLKGRSVRDINRLYDLMYQSSIFWNREGVGIGVMGGIDIALYDLLGKLLDVPVYQLLGGRCRPRTRIYASNGLFDDLEPLVADVRRAAEMGFRAYKMRVVTSDTIIPLVAGLCDAVGSDMDIIVDAVQGSCAVPWSLTVAKRLARALEPYGILFFEEPCRVEDIEGYVELRRSSPVSIAGAESIPTALAFKPYLDRGAFDVVQFDIATSGFTEGARIAALAGLHRKPVAIHSWGTIVSCLAGVHMALATPECVMTEYCFMDHPLNDLISLTPFRPIDGFATALDAPGLGIAFDDALQQRYPYDPSINTMISTAEQHFEF
jgi:L-alanine-DL-glutamate epimerase-like enolase superfamily enzyme